MLPELTFSQARPPARKFFVAGIHSGWSVTCVSPTDFFAKVRRTRCPPSRVKKRPSTPFHRQSFHFDTEDTGPAYTQVQIQHRSRAAPGGPPSAFHTFRRKSFAFQSTRPLSRRAALREKGRIGTCRSVSSQRVHKVRVAAAPRPCLCPALPRAMMHHKNENQNQRSPCSTTS